MTSRRPKWVPLAAFGGGLVILLGAALGIGALTRSHHDKVSPPAGYRLANVSTPAAAGQPGTLSFQVHNPGGETVNFYETVHDKQLHLIVVRSDTSQYRHVHPALDGGGHWTMDWAWAAGGRYRIYADFTPMNGEPQIAFADVTVSGESAPVPLPPPALAAEVDGYRAQLTGRLETANSELNLTISQLGKPVTNLDPYLGAYGHLVAIRASDLAYLHVHPMDGPPGPTIQFHTQAPGPGDYRLFLDFSHNGKVHTAAFTVVVADPAPASGGKPHHGGN